MQDIRGKKKDVRESQESPKLSEDDSEEAEVSQNHLRKLESMAKNISLGNKKKEEPPQKEAPKRPQVSVGRKKSEGSPSQPSLSPSPGKGKTIVASDSYAKNIGFGRQLKSPGISSKSKSNLTQKTRKKSKGRPDKTEGPGANKERGQANPTPSKRSEGQNHQNKQVRLQQKYTQNNAMTKTPNPKMSQYNKNAHSRKSQTPEPTAASNLFNNLNREPLISTELTKRKYCLVLDLDETLIHFKNDNGRAKFLIRPYTYNFLRNLEKFYELIIFTAAQKEYADWILDKIDNKVGLSDRDSYPSGSTATTA